MFYDAPKEKKRMLSDRKREYIIRNQQHSKKSLQTSFFVLKGLKIWFEIEVDDDFKLCWVSSLAGAACNHRYTLNIQI